MIRGLSTMKHQATNSNDSTISILATGLETMTDSTVSKLSIFDSIKRTIRRQRLLYMTAILTIRFWNW